MNGQERLEKLKVFNERIEATDKSIAKAKLARMTVQLRTMKTEVTRWQREANNYRDKLTNIEMAVRNLMDVTEYDGEAGESRKLRHYVWNDEDTIEKIRAERCQP